MCVCVTYKHKNLLECIYRNTVTHCWKCKRLRSVTQGWSVPAPLRGSSGRPRGWKELATYPPLHGSARRQKPCQSPARTGALTAPLLPRMLQQVFTARCEQCCAGAADKARAPGPAAIPASWHGERQDQHTTILPMKLHAVLLAC